jgi:hypothetical protein
VAFVREQALRRTEHMTRRMERNGRAGAELFSLPEWQDVFHAGSRQPGAQKPGGCDGANDLPMRGNVVGMCV